MPDDATNTDFLLPPDQEQRELILRELDRNMLVEAAAGTGKTTSMVGRMLALLESGKCADIRHLAAVTFTRKAAAELRGRFQVELERRVREAEGEGGERLGSALDRVEQCYIGTIHSFCARLLRERPVEAGVGLDFKEIDDVEDSRLLEEAWEAFVAELTVSDPAGLLERLVRLGLTLADLKTAFADFCRYPDVEEWPTPPATEEPDLEEAREELLRYNDHLRELVPRLPEEVGNDNFIPLLKRLFRFLSHLHDMDRPERLIEALEYFDANPKIVQKIWIEKGGFSGEEAKAEKSAWDDLRDRVARPALRAWREYRYPTVIEVLQRARLVYDGLRQERGLLNFQDLLMKAAALLRDHPEVRRYFHHRFTHLLVDEFQDTDPIQAEVIFLLASSDPEERDWRACAPRPGSLFLVGDPKQSIYRFRRADIATYAEARRVLEELGGGLTVNLRANFRSSPPVISWVNEVFEPGEPSLDVKGRALLRFPEVEAPESPFYVPLLPGRKEGESGGLCGVYRLPLPEECSKNEIVREYEPDLVARIIRDALDRGMTVSRTRGEIEGGKDPRVRPDDFMIVTRKTHNLGAFARALQRYGIPHRVTGGQALNEVEELHLLYLCLRAVARPEDPIALVAALRSELFGISDARLYAYRKAGGLFSFRCDPPAGLDEDVSRVFMEAYARLRRYARWLDRLPLASACERIARDLGLFALAAARSGGDAQAGSLAKGIELLRATLSGEWSVAQAVEYIGMLARGEEKHDGTPALAGTRPEVRVMNLHKVKGLEAPVVFLADPCGEFDHGAEVHIDRSGEKIRGYLAIYSKSENSRRKKILAHPARWEDLEEKEGVFKRAEELRLRYVAATRCGAAVIISQRKARNDDNPWCYFDRFIPQDRVIPDPGPQEAPAIPAVELPPGEPEASMAKICSRLDATTSPTYDVLAAKEYALSQAGGPGAARAVGVGQSDTEGSAPPSGHAAPASAPDSPQNGEHGPEWGEVIHALLQAAMAEPDLDMEKLAATLLEEKEMEPGFAPSAAALTRSVMASEIWRRAQAAEKRLTEVPFQIPWDEGGRPAILRGVIDLAFREADGWVVVDYKTDLLREGELKRAAEKYAPQVLLYAEALMRACGEPVKETLIHFTATGELVRAGGKAPSQAP
ncbi:MAG: UvrD-helicase domain-containing protein [Actinobacteria bacterium]|nr:UvrD-helicase domain-containing protein [Actinomycetota bacterium]